MNRFFEKNLLVIVLILLLALPGLQANLQCKMGEVRCNGLCEIPKQIEGCLKYKSRIQCEICQFNYVKKGGICEYQQGGQSQASCEQFDYFGQCNKCKRGFYLHPQSKQCIDNRIPGCLQKSLFGQECTNCASQFSLFNGICLSKIPSCIQYKLNGAQFICTKCSENYKLTRGQCTQNFYQIDCVGPYIKNSFNKCFVLNCKLEFQFGCYQCQDQYELTNKGECLRKKIPGCVNYVSETQCKSCQQNSYELVKGICYPIGCKQLVSSQNNLICSKCDSKSGFLIQKNGICIIPHCLLPGTNGCNICQQGRIWYEGRCSIQNQIQRTVCINCPSSHFLNAKKECQQKQLGCLNYQDNICISCEQNFFYDLTTKKCIRRLPGCLQYQRSQCTSCQANYFHRQGRCFIIGCKSYNQNFRCTDCQSGFSLTNFGFCMIQNCIQISQQGCVICHKNYILSQGNCINADINCVATNILGKCIGCKDGFYLDLMTNKCTKTQNGCNYINGKCTSCKTPFVYDGKTQSCFIDGCERYFIGGCESCVNGYQLRYNRCKLPNCLISNKGKCSECDPDYVMKTKTNTCINKDEFCFKYNKQGECTECAPKYFMSNIKNKCILREPGCIYDLKDDCSTCAAPFKSVIGSNKCYLVGCLQHNYDSCKQCKYPFELTQQNLCAIKNCIQNDDNRCIKCTNGYLLQKGVCNTGDIFCAQYNFDNGKCLRCKQGYKIIENRCQYADQNCLSFTRSGSCLNCRNSYFLNQNKMCQLRDSKCQQYVNGRCNKCRPFHYLFNQICYQNSKGCSSQSSLNQCVRCQSGYTFNKLKQCQLEVKQLNWNSIDMDFSNQFENQKQPSLNSKTFTNGKENKQNLIPSLRLGKGKLFYSSDIDNKKICHLDSNNFLGWIPRTNTNQFIGVQVANRETFYAVDIKCMARNKIITFFIQFLDNNLWKKQGQYQILCESAGIIKTIYISPVETTSLRLMTRKGIPNIQIQFYYNDKIYKTEQQNKETNVQKLIKQSVQASHQLLNNYCKNQQLCWFGLQICESKFISGFNIIYDDKNQSLGRIDQVYVDYSVDGVSFTCFKQCKAIKITNENVVLDNPVFGSKMRVHVVSYTGKPDMRIQFNYQ